MSQQGVFCHSCQRRDVVDTASWTGSCQYCNSSFTEVVDPHPVSAFQNGGLGNPWCGPQLAGG